jgi:hypothetical protein
LKWRNWLSKLMLRCKSSRAANPVEREDAAVSADLEVPGGPAATEVEMRFAVERFPPAMAAPVEKEE